jgi:hypothetical protein
MMSQTDGKYSCGCGRSPTGQCIGWHALTEEAYQVKLAKWSQQQDDGNAIKQENAINDELETYRQQAMELWFDNGGSCTGDRKSSA